MLTLPLPPKSPSPTPAPKPTPAQLAALNAEYDKLEAAHAKELADLLTLTNTFR